MKVSSMEYVYAALLLHKLGKEVNEGSIKKVVQAAGVSPDEIKVKALVSAIGEVNIDDALKSAMAFQPQAAISAPPAAEAPSQPKEEKAEEKEQEALEGLASLFG